VTEEQILVREATVPAKKIGAWFAQDRGIAAELYSHRFRLASAFPLFKLVPLLDVPTSEIHHVEVQQPAFSIRGRFLITLRESAWQYIFSSAKPMLWIEHFRNVGLEVIETEAFKQRSNGLLGMFRQ
jgi:hypothetical protein